MSRITDLAASNSLLGYILNTQKNLLDLESQVATEKASQDYKGIARDSQHLINFENTRDLLDQFTRNNELMDVRLEIAQESTSGLEETVRDFRDVLLQFYQNADYSEESVADIQQWAFRSLSTIEGYLNTEADGRYLFSGARVTTQPADFGFTELEDFQAHYNGETVTYATTRDAQLADFSLSQDSAGNTNWLYFERDAGASGVSRITGTTGQFANIAPGTTITVSGTGSNDGTYTVQSVGGGGTTIDVVTKQLTNEANQAAATLTTANGDKYTAVDFTDLTFDRATSTITAAAAGSLSAVEVGSTITIGGTTNNDNAYTVVSNDGTNIVVASKTLTDEGSAGSEVAGTISAASYYSGDTTVLTHRVDDDRSFSYDLTAVDPAFEKAIRAMSIIAQGEFGTAGGLDQNQDRVGDALYLLDNSLDATTSSSGPYGTEQTGNLERVLKDLSFDRVLINRMNTTHENFINYLDGQIDATEGVDNLEVITKLLDESRVLEASYEAMSRIRQLSLTNYMS
jgi:flagellin-like hook-associated protein FlgL